MGLLSDGISHQNPIQRLVDGAENANPRFTVQLAVNFKHSGQAELEIVLHHEGAAGLRRKDVSLRELAYILRPDIKTGEMREIQNLGVIRVKIRVT